MSLVDIHRINVRCVLMTDILQSVSVSVLQLARLIPVFGQTSMYLLLFPVRFCCCTLKLNIPLCPTRFQLSLLNLRVRCNEPKHLISHSAYKTRTENPFLTREDFQSI